ncbi:MAG: DUF362 domain-containing protein [Candidatus Omnitrophota bacterium]|nr:DUF362 domain-containing protein [Candidatus Omnitrophota bacterium]
MQNHSKKSAPQIKIPPPSKVFLKRLSDWSSDQKINETVLSAWQNIEPLIDFITAGNFVAIKLTFGEEGASGYIKSAWLSGLIKHLKEKTENLFIAETNTLYREKRSNAVGHLQIASSHGYGLERTGIPVIIADGLLGRDGQNISIRGDHFETVKIARGICESDSMICISHVTGHMQSGFAGTLKNLGMGCASRQGKLLQHSGTLPEVTLEKCVGCGACMRVCPANAIGIKKKKAILVKERCIGCGECTVVCRSGAIDIKYDENVVKFQEKMVEYAMGVKKALNSRVVYLNFIEHVTKNCDCMSKDETPIAPDIGIALSSDPVAIDKASMDLVGIEKFKEAFPEIDPLTQIKHAEKIKLGIGQYELLEI